MVFLWLGLYWFTLILAILAKTITLVVIHLVVALSPVVGMIAYFKITDPNKKAPHV